jgi:hypothetical protein
MQWHDIYVVVIPTAGVDTNIVLNKRRQENILSA